MLLWPPLLEESGGATTNTRLQKFGAFSLTSRKSQLPLTGGKQEVQAPEGIMGQEVEPRPVGEAKAC